jgi:hypothetical protein
MAPTLTLCGKAASRYAGPAFGCPAACGLVFAAPTGGAAAHCRLCIAGRLRGRGDMLREFPASPFGAALQEA